MPYLRSAIDDVQLLSVFSSCVSPTLSSREILPVSSYHMKETLNGVHWITLCQPLIPPSFLGPFQHESNPRPCFVDSGLTWHSVEPSVSRALIGVFRIIGMRYCYVPLYVVQLSSLSLRGKEVTDLVTSPIQHQTDYLQAIGKTRRVIGLVV